MNKIGVGIIGASPINPGWAVHAHIPAIRALPEYELRAVSTSRRESAKAAAEEFGVTGFDNNNDMFAHPGVDLVVVAVKVPLHHSLVYAALNAGKMVLCEWPLGNGLAEAENLAKRAETAGVRTAIGLQARFAPAIKHARDLVADGYIGKVLATTLVGSGTAWGAVTDRAHAYWFDAANGATTLSVSCLHALDALGFMLGDFDQVSAKLAVRRRTVHVADEGKELPVSAPDQLAIIGTLRAGAPFSTFYRGGVSRGDNFRWEINGSEGDLVLTSKSGNIQAANPKLEGGRGEDATVQEIIVPPPYFELAPSAPDGPAGNVARLYAQFAKDLSDGTQATPNFAYAVTRHRLINAIEEANRTGVTQNLKTD